MSTFKSPLLQDLCTGDDKLCFFGSREKPKSAFSFHILSPVVFQPLIRISLSEMCCKSAPSCLIVRGAEWGARSGSVHILHTHRGQTMQKKQQQTALKCLEHENVCRAQKKKMKPWWQPVALLPSGGNISQQAAPHMTTAHTHILHAHPQEEPFELTQTHTRIRTRAFFFAHNCATLKTFWKKRPRFLSGKTNGQLRDSTFGLFPVTDWHRGSDHRDHPAPVEDVGLRRGQHHHGRGHVPGIVDVLRLPEYGTAPVQDLRFHPHSSADLPLLYIPIKQSSMIFAIQHHIVLTFCTLFSALPNKPLNSCYQNAIRWRTTATRACQRSPRFSDVETPARCCAVRRLLAVDAFDEEKKRIRYKKKKRKTERFHHQHLTGVEMELECSRRRWTASY